MRWVSTGGPFLREDCRDLIAAAGRRTKSEDSRVSAEDWSAKEEAAQSCVTCLAHNTGDPTITVYYRFLPLYGETVTP